MAYLRQRTWLENGPGLSGLGALDCPDGQQESPAGGVCVPVISDSVTVSAASPDICLKFPFPWVGRRADSGSDPAWQDTNGRYCQPVIDVPSSIGKWVTYGVIGLAVFSLFRGGRR